MSQTIPQNRYTWADCAKGLSIILVVHLHSTFGVEADLGVSGVMGDIAGFGASFRMPLFFMVAGLFLGSSLMRNWRDYIDHKVLHLVYFYVLWTLINCVLKCLPEVGWSLSALLAKLPTYLYEPMGTMWFIYVLALFFIATKLLLPLGRYVLLALAIGLELVPISTGFTAVDAFAANYVFFVVGVVFADTIKERVGQSRLPFLATLAIFAAAFAANLMAYQLNLFHAPGAHLLLGVALPLAILLSLKGLVERVPLGWLAYCGKYSIVIYLSFFLPMAVTRILLIKTGIITHVDVISGITFLVAVTSPLVVHWLIKDTRLKFFYSRPQWVHLPQAKEKRVVHPAE